MRRLHLLWSKICKEILVGFNVLAARQVFSDLIEKARWRLLDYELLG
ncbi:hypothetical protein WN944_018963 [Citrus x changshan-huyou]|uniref:Uncharacterized protein n=1 Tax=Citrus x changshan-huyou TaxID=2935761 RepID=A0AAP0QEP3_9ROSI